MIRRIRDLLYDQGFTIIGARNKLQESVPHERDRRSGGEVMLTGMDVVECGDSVFDSVFEVTDFADFSDSGMPVTGGGASAYIEHEYLRAVRRELGEIRDLLANGL